MKIISQSKYKTASQILSKGGLVAFPTETVFGIGVVFNNEESYKRLINVKKRPPEKPFTLMCSDLEQIERYAVVDKLAKTLINAYMPGQFTIILKAKPGLPKWVVSSEGNVGIRIPDYDLVRDLIREVGSPLLVPSANKSGEKPLTTSEEVYNMFKDEIDAVVEGESVSNTPSTIVLIGDSVQIIREGMIDKKDIERVLEESK